MRRSTITFLADYPNWAFDFVAKSISYRLRHKYRFLIRYSSRRPILDPHATDLLYVFFWGENWHTKFHFAPNQVIREVASFRWKFEEQFGLISANEFANRYLTDCALVTTPAGCLYDELSPHVAELYLCPNGVEHSLFASRSAHALSGPLKIGWVGNPSDNSKGLHDILIPATDRYEFFYTNGDLSRTQLIKFYRNIDVLAIASLAEGQPLPLLEGLACGCFVVTTKVGIVPEVIVDRGSALVVNRSVQEFQRAFNWCENNLEQIRARRSDRLHYASRQSWDIWADRFEHVFDLALERQQADQAVRTSLAKRIDRHAWGQKEKSQSVCRCIWVRYVFVLWDYWTQCIYGTRYRKGILAIFKSCLTRARRLAFVEVN